MESFREALDRLVIQLNRDVLSTIEAITLDELSAVVGKAGAAAATAKAPKALKAPKAPKAPKARKASTPLEQRRPAPSPAAKTIASKPSEPRAAKKARKAAAPTPTAPSVSAAQLEQAMAFAASRGSKGVIARQLDAHLVSLGFAGGANVLGMLAERNMVRDAGFRRATGNGNATEPVFVAIAR